MMTPLIAVPDTLITTYLEMTSRDQFMPGFVTLEADVQVIEAKRPDIDYYRFLYRAVGYHLRWRDRLIMADETLEAILQSSHVRIDVLHVGGVPAGYAELARDGESCELAFFGLRPQHQGRGLGKHLLSASIARAWDWGIRRLWVHTCNMDGPHALDNYLKRGFHIYSVTEEPMPDRYKT